jgi:hypothetical protein
MDERGGEKRHPSLMIGTDVCLSMAVMCVVSKDGYLMQGSV